MSDLIRREDALKTLSALVDAAIEGRLTERTEGLRDAKDIIRTLPAVQPDREHIAFSMWKAEADRAAPNVGKNRTASGFACAAEQERERWLMLADAARAALKGETP